MITAYSFVGVLGERMVVMNFSAANLDKILTQKTAKRLSPVSSERNLLRSFYQYLRSNFINFSLAALFLTGVLIGTILVGNASEQTMEALKVILGGYLERRQTQAFIEIMTSTFCSIFVSMVILFFCGFCTISQPIIFAVPLFKGLGYGFSIGTLYVQYGSSAIPYVASLMLPTMFFSTLLLIIASRASLLLSITLFRSTLINTEQLDQYRAKRYCVKYIAFTVVCLLISLVDAILYYRLSRLFVF